MNIGDILNAMKADHIPACESGLWTIQKVDISVNQAACSSAVRGKKILPGLHTILRHVTMETLHNGGEVVMEDSLPELNTHLNFILNASGNVLVSGLGLGCVIRGLLCKDNINRIFVLERDQLILDMVTPYLPNDDRLEIIKTDAIQWTEQNKDKFDYAWHDVWSNSDLNEPKLSFIHMDLLKNMKGKANKQGAWGMGRFLLKTLRRASCWYDH